MKKKIALVALSAVCALGVGAGLSGCSCSSDSVSNANNANTSVNTAANANTGADASAQADATSFAGSWVVNGGTYNNTDLNDTVLSTLAQQGLHASIVFSDDGTFTADVFGESVSGKWSQVDETSATLTYGDEESEAVLEDGQLSTSLLDCALLFVKGTPESSSSRITGQEALATLAAVVSDAGDEPTYTDVTEVNQQAVNDGNATVTVVSKATDEAGMAGALLKVENKTDHTIMVVAEKDTFTVNGKACNPFVQDTVAAGSTANCFLFFYSADVASVNDLNNVKGTLQLLDVDGESDLEYEISF